MAYPGALGITAGIALLGATLGVQFGHSAISEMDPDRFSRWDEYHSFSQYSAAQAGDYPGEAAGLGAQPVTTCGDCALGTGQYPWLQRAVFSDAELGVADVPTYAASYSYEEAAPPSYAPESAGDVPERTSNVARYAYYQVDAADEPEAIAAHAELAEAEAPPATECEGEDCQPVGM